MGKKDKKPKKVKLSKDDIKRLTEAENIMKSWCEIGSFYDCHNNHFKVKDVGAS